MKSHYKAAVLALALAAGSSGASAAVLQSSTSAGFAADAAGITLSTIDFHDGVSSGTRNGSSYSPDVVFSSGSSGFGGTNSALVNDSAVEMGPVGGYNGLLVMDFVADLSAISFASFQLDAPETISLYNNGLLVATLLASTAGVPGFDGFVGTAGTVFDRVVLDGSFYSLSNLSYGFAQTSPVPVPAALPLLATGLGILGLVARRRKAKNA